MKTASPAQILRFAYFTLAMLYVVLLAPAQSVPALVNYQGRLANPDGSPLPTADYTLTFKVFDAATNGALVWGPQVFDGVAAQGHGARIPVVQGYFNVMLGPVDTGGSALSDAFNGTLRYVEVTVSNRPPITPRQQILTTPFAFQAANSAKLAGYDWSALLGTNNPVAGTISGARLTDGTIGIGKLAARPVAANAPAGGLAFGPSVTADTTAGAMYDFSVTLVTTGRPVFIALIPTATDSYLQCGGANGPTIVFLRDAASFASLQSVPVTSSSFKFAPSVVFTVDPTPGAGTYEFRIHLDNMSFIKNVRLVAFEL